ncbi:alginate lyase family protein [Filimonas effusa]|uniref:Cell wall anchor protein n=1 Tax=Filimonas effusa TaxID=2508721 RepID=A0A4Q1DBL9_9BACT|nr:alginate lyase family protein [Filimonas effusa]RXK86837.1 cell wall anchor protein [Filimonas effusa]
MNLLLKTLCSGALLLLLASACTKHKFDFGSWEEDSVDTLSNLKLEHPCMLHTNADFTFVKAKVDAGASPWKEGWAILAASSYANASYAFAPVVKLIRGGGSREEPDPDNYGAAYRDAAAAYQLALRWKLSGDVAFANKAIAILNAWAATCTSINGDSNRWLASGLYGYQFANAAEILRGYSGWAAADFDKFKKWMLNIFYPLALNFLETHGGTCSSHYWTNWDIANMNTVLAIGILCDDQSKINYAINYFKKGAGTGNINNAVIQVFDVNGDKLGQGQESGRDQGHATLNISLYGSFCQMAYNIGVDLFAYDNNKVLALAEYTAKYNVDLTTTVPFTPYKNCDPVSLTPEHTTVSAAQRGTIRPSWELIYNHYTKVKGIKATWSQKFAEAVRPEGGGGNYGPNSGGFDQLGFGTLMYSK